MFSRSQQEFFLAKAETLKPQLKRWKVSADSVVTPAKECTAWQDYRMVKGDLDTFLQNNDFANGSSFIVSLPETTVGQLAFTI
ncbi:MAG: hypothetical protein IKC94_04035, partial [Lentisphaeria bacterium]|nr:hypothetical protein [Lentisphaeria bacterium]